VADGEVGRPRRALRRLYTARAARSFGQGLLVVDFPLYLHALHWPAWQIGLVLGGGLLIGALLTMAAGPLSDRYGRRRFLVGYEGVTAAAALVMCLTGAPVLVAAAAIVGGFGRGENGSAGPFAPVEMAWLAGFAPRRARSRVYSMNTAIGATGMALGALCAGAPELLAPAVGGLDSAYRLMFILPLIGALIAAGALRSVPERDPPPPPSEDAGERVTAREENRRLAWLVAANGLNGAGIGLIGPLLAWWFAARFGVGALAIGPVMAAAFAASAPASLYAGWLAHRFGVIRTVVVMRVAALALLFAFPLVGTFWLAALLNVLRSALNRGTAGSRAALNLGLVRAHRRGLAASLSNVSLQIPRAVGPAVAGLLFSAGSMGLPFFLAVGLQGAYLWVYAGRLGRFDPNAPRPARSD
jgi:Arabinose efflux permease